MIQLSVFRNSDEVVSVHDGDDVSVDDDTCSVQFKLFQTVHPSTP